MKRHAIIKDCTQRDRDPAKPAHEQRVCLFSKDGDKLLGRHPDAESAKQQEAAIHARGGSAEKVVTRMYIKLAEVPASAVKSLYNEKWGEGIMKVLGEDFSIDSKASQFLFFTVWNGVIQLMDSVLQKQYKLDTTKYAEDPTFMQSLAGLAYFVTDDAIKSSVGVKSDSLPKAKGHAEALMSVIDKEADVDQTLQGLKSQAAPLVEKAFDRVTTYLKEQPAEQQKAASVNTTAEFDPEEARGYLLSYTYGIVTPESAEQGDYAEQGYDIEDVEYATLEDLVDAVDYDHTWLEWSSSPAQPGDWITSQEDENYQTGENTTYDAHITHQDGSDLSWVEMLYIHERLRLYGEVQQPTQQDLALGAARLAEKLSDKMLHRRQIGESEEPVDSGEETISEEPGRKIPTRDRNKVPSRDRDAVIPEAETVTPAVDEIVQLFLAADDLQNLLERIQYALRTQSDEDFHAAFKLVAHDLPSFGGTDPEDTTGIWSWDDTHQLSGDNPRDLFIELRPGETGAATPQNREPLPQIREPGYVPRGAALEVVAMPRPKELDRMVAGWLRELPRDATGHRSVILYPLVAMDAPPQEWVEAAEREELYIKETLRDSPYFPKWMRAELNDKFAVTLDEASRFGKVGSYVYAENAGYWVLMFETPAIEDVLRASTSPPVTEGVPPAEAVMEDVTAALKEARAPAMQLTQQVGQLPREKGKREKPQVDSKVKKFFQWLGKKSHEAGVRQALTPQRKKEVEIQSLYENMLIEDPDFTWEDAIALWEDESRHERMMEEVEPWMGKEYQSASVRHAALQTIAAWPRIAAAHKVIDRRIAARTKSCGCGRKHKAADDTATNAIQLPTDCVAEVIGVAYSKQAVTTFEKQGNKWFVEGVDSKGIIDDTLIQTLSSYCEMQKTTRAKTAALRPTDKKVVDAFMNKQSGEGRILSSDGNTLTTSGYMGSGAVIARWDDEDHISILDEYSSRTEQSAAAYLRKVVPRNWQREHGQRDASVTTEAAPPLTADEVMRYYRDVDEAAVAHLVAQFNEGIGTSGYSEWLRKADQVLENHGVETVDLSSEAGRWELNYDEAFIAEYSNTGDSYHPTFLWDIEREEMLWTGWADFLEGWEREREEEMGEEGDYYEESTNKKEKLMKRKADYDWVTDDMFAEKLVDILDGQPNLALGLPGAYEVLSEDLNNAAMDLGGDFDEALASLVMEMSGRELLQVPGFYEVASEELNNDVLAALEEERDEETWEPDEDELHESYVIQNARGGGQELAYMGKVLDTGDQDELVKTAVENMEREKYYPNIYLIGERGSIDILDAEGNMIEASTTNKKEQRPMKRKAITLALDPEYSGVGKYNDNIDEYVDGLALEGWAAESMGDVDELGHFDLVVFEEGDPLVISYPDAVDPDETFVAAVVEVNSQGFVNVYYFKDKADADKLWANIEAEYATYYDEVEAENPGYFD